MSLNLNRTLHTAVLVATLLAFSGFAALLAPAASAQSAFCVQYPSDPDCQGAIGPTGGDGELLPSGGAGDSDPSATGDGTASGELPFTGYPMTPLLLLLLALLAAGILLRTYLAVRTRLRARGDLATS